jgi:hypothetical protein
MQVSRRRSKPPEGYISTTEAAELLGGVSASYVRRLIANAQVGERPGLKGVAEQTPGGRTLHYVRREEVEQLRNSGDVRPRRKTARLRDAQLEGQAPLRPQATAGTTQAGEVQAREAQAGGTQAGEVQATAGSPPARVDDVTRERNAEEAFASSRRPNASGAASADWQTELELVAANSRASVLVEQVRTLERVNELLERENTELRRRLNELSRAMMQMLEGYSSERSGPG